MDPSDSEGEAYAGFTGGAKKKPRDLPADLPKSLDDRKRPTGLVPETEMYDGWQGNHNGSHHGIVGLIANEPPIQGSLSS